MLINHRRDLSLRGVVSSSSLFLYWGKNSVSLILSIFFKVFLINICGNRSRVRPKTIWFQKDTSIRMIQFQKPNIVIVAIVRLGINSNLYKIFLSSIVKVNNISFLGLRMLNIMKASKKISKPWISIFDDIFEILLFRNRLLIWSELSDQMQWIKEITSFIILKKTMIIVHYDRFLCMNT